MLLTVKSAVICCGVRSYKAFCFESGETKTEPPVL